MSIRNQQELAQEFIEKLEIIDPTCILAGGAPRDWYLGKECNDLDFYVHINHETQAATLLRFKRLGLNASPLPWDHSRNQYAVMKHLRGVYEGEYKGQKYNIMVMEESTYDCVLNNFGTSVCKAYWKNIHSGVQVTTEFLVSHITKTIFKKDDYTAKVFHVAKMTKRYPDYKVKDYREYPKHLKALCDKLCSKSGNFGVYDHLEKHFKGEKQ